MGKLTKLTRLEWINKRRKKELKIKITEDGINLEPKTDFEREFLEYHFKNGNLKTTFDNKSKRLIIEKIKSNEMFKDVPQINDDDLPF